jgi:hypothetical protein
MRFAQRLHRRDRQVAESNDRRVDERACCTFGMRVKGGSIVLPLPKPTAAAPARPAFGTSDAALAAVP